LNFNIKSGNILFNNSQCVGVYDIADDQIFVYENICF